MQIDVSCNKKEVPKKAVRKQRVTKAKETIELEQKEDIIAKKMKILAYNLHHNIIENKQNACFWDTFEFENVPFHIPIRVNNSKGYDVYGCFCSPECACAFLNNEKLSEYVRADRMQLLNNLYSTNDMPISPAADPYHLLEKYRGNLTIQEYRSLLKNDRLYMIVNKPLTQILPELYEHNEDNTSSSAYQIKKKVKKSMAEVFSEKFGISIE